MRRFFLAALAFIAFALPLVAQAKHPFTFEDMMKLKRVGEPEVSPDSKWVIFSVVDVDLEANTKTPHIWIVPTAGGQEREIVADQDADRPRWAPDGKRFAFISTKEQGSQVWIAEFDGTAGTVPRRYRLTDIATEADGELWSPDGKNILFKSDVYPECDAPDEDAECNARRVKEVEQSKVKVLIFEHLLYRHWNAYKEGKRTHILVVSTPSIPSPSSSRIESTPAVRPVSFQSHPVTTTSDQVPNQLSTAPTESLPLGGGPRDQIKLLQTFPIPRDLTPGDYDAPVFSLGGQDNYAFSPDGQEICYTSNHDKNPAASTNNDLWIVPVSGGPAKNITADNPASDSTPLYSPDGRYIAYRAQQRPGYESDRFRLMLYDRKTDEKKNLTQGFDKWVGTYVWAADSSSLYFVSEDKGTSPIHSISFETKADQEKGYDISIKETNIKIDAFAPGSDDDLAIASDGRLFYTSTSVQKPNEIWALTRVPCSNTLAEDPSAGERAFKHLLCLVNPLTHLNDAVLSEVAMSPLESFWFTGAHNDKVEGFLVKPPNFDVSKKYPVKFLIHGGPQGAWGDDWSYRWNPELFASPTSAASGGYVVIMINFHGSTGYGQKFIDAVNGDWGGAPFEDLMKGLDYAEKTYPFIDKDRECALGASYGGYMANWILGHTDRFKCIVSHDGLFNTESGWGTTEELWYFDWEFKGTPYDNRAMYEKWSPHQYAKNFKTPTLVIHGQSDYRYDVSESLQLFTTLQIEGVPSKMLYFPDEGHWVLKPQNSQLWYKTVNDWVDQWTKDRGTQK